MALNAVIGKISKLINKDKILITIRSIIITIRSIIIIILIIIMEDSNVVSQIIRLDRKDFKFKTSKHKTISSRIKL